MIIVKDGIIHVEDTGVTLRTLLQVANDNQVPGKRVYKIAYTNGIVIGSVRIRQEKKKSVSP